MSPCTHCMMEYIGGVLEGHETLQSVLLLIVTPQLTIIH